MSTRFPDALAGLDFPVELSDGEVVVDAMILCRVQDLESGTTSFVVTKAQTTDEVVAAGLLACAEEIRMQANWEDKDDD